MFRSYQTGQVISAVVLAMTFHLAACSDEVSKCVPGATQQCYCAGGKMGVQGCGASGTWGQCQGCTPASDGCVANCAGRKCGTDGCGGSCGSCNPPNACQTSTGKCVANCTPNCTGKQCGSNGCGGSCGKCTGGQICTSSGQCKTVGNGGCIGATMVCTKDSDCPSLSYRCVKAPLLNCSQAGYDKSLASMCSTNAATHICGPIRQCKAACIKDSDCGAIGKCVNSVCQLCGNDSHCGGGTKCYDISFYTRCTKASDCPGAVGIFGCSK